MFKKVDKKNSNYGDFIKKSPTQSRWKFNTQFIL